MVTMQATNACRQLNELMTNLLAVRDVDSMYPALQ